jgi:hypothetical protein
MSMTVEFYSANPAELVAIFETDLVNDDEDGEAFFEQLKAYPVADFSLRLYLPDDLDSICRLLHKQDPLFPRVFGDVLLEQIWDDGPAMSESLTLISHQFADALAALSERQIETVAREWVATFPDQESLVQAPMYRAVYQLQEVARDAVMREQSLIFHFVG